MPNCRAKPAQPVDLSHLLETIVEIYRMTEIAARPVELALH